MKISCGTISLQKRILKIKSFTDNSPPESPMDTSGIYKYLMCFIDPEEELETARATVRAEEYNGFSAGNENE